MENNNITSEQDVSETYGYVSIEGKNITTDFDELKKEVIINIPFDYTVTKKNLFDKIFIFCSTCSCGKRKIKEKIE